MKKLVAVLALSVSVVLTAGCGSDAGTDAVDTVRVSETTTTTTAETTTTTEAPTTTTTEPLVVRLTHPSTLRNALDVAAEKLMGRYVTEEAVAARFVKWYQEWERYTQSEAHAGRSYTAAPTLEVAAEQFVTEQFPVEVQANRLADAYDQAGRIFGFGGQTNCTGMGYAFPTRDPRYDRDGDGVGCEAEER